MDKKEIYSLYEGLQLLDKEDIELFGIERDSDFGWTATSIQYAPFKKYKHKGKTIKVGWHCHGNGKTPKAAILDMKKQVIRYLDKTIIESAKLPFSSRLKI